MADCIGLCNQSCECMNTIGLPAAITAEIRLFFIRENWSSLKRAKEDLQALQSLVNAKVTKETEKPRDVNPIVQLWLSRVEEVITDTTLEQEHKKLTSCRFNLTLRHKLGKQIIKRLQDVNRLLEEAKQFTDVGIDLPDGPGYVIPQAETFGMAPMLEQLRKYFEDNEKSIIGVWGPGGVGKSTLLNVFNNQLMDDCRDFHIVILIDVSNSETLNVKAVQRTIIDRLGLPWVDTEAEDVRARLIMKALSRKRFVILLDDVQQRFELKDIGIPLLNNDNRSKIILTSRDQDVCIQMGAQHSLIRMQLLDDQVSWDLFFSNLSTESQRSIKSSYSIKWRAEAISKSCHGLPLALKVTSRAVAALWSPYEWRDAMTAISMGLGEIGGDEIFQRLKYSYDQLESTAKECFLYCTLFPESSSIRKEQLVEYWIAEGFIPAKQSWRGTVIIIRKLISACLLQETNSGQKVRMHNIIHQFGQWLAKKNSNFLVQSGKNLASAPEIEEWNGPKRISLMSNDIRDLSFSPNCSNLATLFLQNNSRLKRMDPRFFRYMKNLKVLDLSNTGINELPDCDALGQLQHLNLSQTPIRKLPKRFWVLKELRYLDLSLTDSLEETHDNCSKLLKLRVLNLFRSHYGIRDVYDLNLDRLKELNSLGITICTEEVLKKLKKTDPLAKSTHRLSLTDCPNMQSIHVTDFSQMVCLQELYIESCPNLCELVMDQDDGAVSNLRVLTLQELPNLNTILVPHSFRRLRELTIYVCHKLKNIDWVARLESLDKLVVSQCNGMEHIIAESKNIKNRMQSRRDGMSEEEEEEEEIQPVDEDVAGTNEFPNLRSIVLSDLENLVRICNPRKFPSLESIRVQGCPKLTRLPIIHEHDITKLRQICGASEWWNRLGWDDINTRRDLEKYFIAI